MLAGVALQLAADRLLGSVEARTIAGLAATAPLLIPTWALIARRLHDQGRTGWWALFLPPLQAFLLYDQAGSRIRPFDPTWQDPGAWTLLFIVPSFLLAVIILAPGDVADNLYGRDPRLEPEMPAAA